MKKTILAMALTLMMFPVMAQQPASKADKPQQQMVQNTAEFDKQLVKMQEEIAKMQQQMEKIRKTQDPQERKKLLQEHWESMQSAMNVMHKMGSPSMMEGGKMGHGMMGWGHMSDYYSKITPDQQKQQQYMMDQRMNMHQMMMDQMMQHQYLMGQLQAPPKG